MASIAVVRGAGRRRAVMLAALSLLAGVVVTARAGSPSGALTSTATSAPGAPSGVSAAPGNSSAAVSWTAPADNGSPIISYTVTASPGSASATVDGSHTSATVSQLANGVSYTITVRAASAAGSSGPSLPSNPVTPEPTISIGDETSLEGNSGARTITFPVTLSQPATSVVTVHYSIGQTGVGAGFATGAIKPGSGVDFRTGSGSLTFNPKSTTGLTPIAKLIPVAIYGDSAVEPGETFAVTLWSPTGSYILGRKLGTGTILNDDGATKGLSLGVGDASIVKADSGTQRLTIPVTLSDKAATTVKVNYAMTARKASYSRTASGGGDFGGTLTGTLTFAPGVILKNVGVPIWADPIPDGAENFTVALSGLQGTGVTTLRSTGSGTMLQLPPPVAPVGSALSIGVQVHCDWASWSDSDRTTVLDKMWAAGLRWVRLNQGWPSLEPSKGNYTFSLNDECVSMATARGFHVLETLWRAPSWANGGLSESAPPTNVNDYGNIAQVVASRYDGTHGVGKVDAWEVWNEPDPSQSSWTGTTAQYVQLVKASYPRFHAGDPSTTVVVGGPAGNNTAYIESLYANGLTPADSDVIAVHPYEQPGDNPPETPDPYVGDFNSGSGYMTHSPTLHALMVAHGDGAKPVWWTEFGWSTCVGSALGQWNSCVNETTQGDFTVRALKFVKANYPWVTNVFIYDARNDSSDTSSRSDNFGLLHLNLTPKAGLAAISFYLNTL